MFQSCTIFQQLYNVINYGMPLFYVLFRERKFYQNMIAYCYLLISDILKLRKYFLKLVKLIYLSVPIGSQRQMYFYLLLIIAVNYAIVKSV